MTEPTARIILDVLRRHYLPEGRPPGGIFAPEIQAPQGTRRADLIWQGVTSGSGYKLIGHEIKVSRADLLAELADPTKSDPWQRYCDAWYLVLPSPHLLDGLDIPETWGVMTPPSGRRTRSMTITVRAPALKPADQTPALRTLATWLHWRHNKAEIRNNSDQRELTQLRDQVHDLGMRARTADGGKSPVQRVAEKIVAGIGVGNYDTLGDYWEMKLDVEDVIAELKELGTVRARVDKLRGQLRYSLGDIERVRAGCERIMKDTAEKGTAA